MTSSIDQHSFDIIIIGSGIAGLSSAKTLADQGKQVAVLTKGSVKESSTSYAQGGIAAVMTPEDTTKLHIEDTLSSGDGLCDPDTVRTLVEEGPKRVKELIDIGANFDKEGDDFHYAQEGAHSRRRILHAADSTGREIEKTLGQYLRKQPNVTLFPRTFVQELIIQNGECVGCIATQKDTPILFQAKATIMATGGCGQIYAHNSNPPVATGDGIALGYNAGCSVQDMEFVQFHPTTLYTGDKKPISLFLISEAVRGEGAYLRNSLGERFMPKYHEKAELAYRDVVSRAIFSELKATQSPHVYLDLTHLPRSVRKRFPTIDKRCLDAKIDMDKDLIPVSPGAHYFMGGLSTNSHGETNIKRLFAAGEVASLGLHGANRLASNSLLDGLVFGHRAARKAISDFDSMPTVAPLDMEPREPLQQDIISRCLIAKQTLRHVMWEHVGVIRSKEGLSTAATKLNTLNWLHDIHTWNPIVKEAQNMLTVSQLITEFALKREESRGAHYRSDFPTTHYPDGQRHYKQHPHPTHV